MYIYIYILYLDRYHPGFTQTNNHEAYTDASYSSVYPAYIFYRYEKVVLGQSELY